MIIVEKNEGAKIPYAITGNKISFGEEELTLNLERYERDSEVNIDICRDTFGNLLTGVIPGAAEWYCAQIHIPAREYESVTVEGEPAPEEGSEEEKPKRTLTPLPFDMERCTLTLWASDC